jgi:hypothetical protein
LLPVNTPDRPMTKHLDSANGAHASDCTEYEKNDSVHAVYGLLFYLSIPGASLSAGSITDSAGPGSSKSLEENGTVCRQAFTR